ncbi:transposase-like protein [Bradyrhizobium sp. USDA 4503]
MHRAPDQEQLCLRLLEGPQGDPALDQDYRAENADTALVRLAEFEAEWGQRYCAIGIWRNAWEDVVPFFAFAPGIRKMIYTTNAVEALHRSLRKIIKTRGSRRPLVPAS